LLYKGTKKEKILYLTYLHYFCTPKKFKNNYIMATTADIKNGMCLDIDGQFFFIVEFLHVKPGKGPAFVRTKLKNVMTGRVIDKTFNSGVRIEEVRIERRPHQYLYLDDMGYNFMNNETFEQIPLKKELINGVDFLKEGDTIDIVFHAESETPLYADLPPHVVLEITYTEPGIKGDTSTNSLKPATVETGATVRVPLFIGTGEKIKIDTRDGSYVERVK
jgi:elongation factor P